MSAPILACVLAEHVGTMLQQIGASIGTRVRIEYSQHTTNPFHVWIEDGIHTFHGEDTDAGRALMDANSKRQDWQERRQTAARIAPAPGAPEITADEIPF